MRKLVKSFLARMQDYLLKEELLQFTAHLKEPKSQDENQLIDHLAAEWKREAVTS